VTGAPCVTWCCGAASGTSRLKNPDTQPQGKILWKTKKMRYLSFKSKKTSTANHFTASIIRKYPGMMANFSFFLTASIMRSATSFELSVGTHL
jgi:hypothetical protein